MRCQATGASVAGIAGAGGTNAGAGPTVRVRSEEPTNAVTAIGAPNSANVSAPPPSAFVRRLCIRPSASTRSTSDTMR